MASDMLKKARIHPLGWLLLLALMMALPARATEDKKGGEQVRHLQQKLRALEQEKSQLVQGKSELDTQLKAGADKLSQVQHTAETAGRQRTSLERALKTAETENTALGSKLADTEKTLADTTLRFNVLTVTLQKSEEAKHQLETGLTVRTQSLAECVKKNESLHRLGVTLLTQYEEKSCFGSGMQREMLTQLKRVGVENMVDEYREKLDQELVNQQQDRQLLARQKASQLSEEQVNIAQSKLERLKSDQEKEVTRKVSQQSDLDKITKKVRDVFQNIEW